MQKMLALDPEFLRFPGGNYLEGDTIDTCFKWKQTLGPLEDRPGHTGCWDYRSFDGMGLLEFIHWCEDLKAEPILAVYAGYSLKGAYVKAGPELEPFVQEAPRRTGILHRRRPPRRRARGGSRTATRAVPDQVRRDRQRGLVRQGPDVRRPLRAVLRRDQGQVPARPVHFDDAREKPEGRPGGRPRLPAARGDAPRRRPVPPRDPALPKVFFGEWATQSAGPRRTCAPPWPPPPRGGIGLGTWHTAAEFKDAGVTSAGATLFEPDPAKPLAAAWKRRGRAPGRAPTASSARATPGRRARD